jgi:ParB/RepB/Spo0J family partition protein
MKATAVRPDRPVTKQPAQSHAEKFCTIPVNLIDPNPQNPRQDWEAQRVERMVPSIRRYGLLQPIVVRPAADGRYQLIAGERRLRAAKAAGETAVPCIVRESSDGDAMVQMMVENMQRRELTALERARAIARLCAPPSEGGMGLSQLRVNRLCGKSGTWAHQLLKLLKLPPTWQERFARGDFTRACAQRLAVYHDCPEFLDRVEKDMRDNPWAWLHADDFMRQLDILAAAAADDPKPTRPPRAPRATEAPRAPAHADGAANQNGGGQGEGMTSEELAALVDAIGTVPTLEDLALVRSAVGQRTKQLRSQISCKLRGAVDKPRGAA